MTPASAAYWHQVMPAEGAPGSFVCGRGVFDYTHGWGGNPPGGNPTFVVTHRPGPDGFPAAPGGPPFTFVHDGVESAIRQARQAAQGGDIGLCGASIVQQAINARIVDQICIDLVPVFLGKGIRYFADIDPTITIEGPVQVVEGDRVTHLRYLVHN